MLADNLGYGELGAYGGGILRGAPTQRLDALAGEGMRLLNFNFNVEAQCTPSRSALMTGRFAIRSGTYEVPVGGGPDGLTLWEVTIAELLSAQGYATGIWGKWHLGSSEARFPTNQGFDEWYGIPRTYDEAMWPSLIETKGMWPSVGNKQVGTRRSSIPSTFTMPARVRRPRAGCGAGRGSSTDHGGGDHEPRRGIHQAQRERGQAVLCLRFVLASSHADAAKSGVCGQNRQRRLGRFAGGNRSPCRPGAGCQQEVGIEDNTLVVFASDNGPEGRTPGRATAGRGGDVFHGDGRIAASTVHYSLAGQSASGTDQ